MYTYFTLFVISCFIVFLIVGKPLRLFKSGNENQYGVDKKKHQAENLYREYKSADAVRRMSIIKTVAREFSYDDADRLKGKLKIFVDNCKIGYCGRIR